MSLKSSLGQYLGQQKTLERFIGIVVYYRIFITSFAIIAAPIFELFRKDVKFSWTPERQNAMDELKRRLTEAPILITLDFSPSALMIILKSMPAPRLDEAEFYLNCNLMEGYDRQDLKVESGVRQKLKYDLSSWNAGDCSRL